MSQRGRPINGSDTLSVDTIAAIKKVYPKVKTFYNRHLKGGDITASTFYRAMDLEPVLKSAAERIDNLAARLRSRHTLNDTELVSAVDRAVLLCNLVRKAVEGDKKYAEQLAADADAFLSAYDGAIEKG
jgi:glycerophosphoryl diester phosphodiesterase